MVDIYQSVSVGGEVGGGCRRSNNTLVLKTWGDWGEKPPPTWLQRIHFEMANLSAGICTLWFIIAKAFAPPLSSMCFKY